MPGHKIPWFPFYPDDFQNDEKVQFMSFADRGLYFSLICLMWIGDQCSVPADRRRLGELVFRGADRRLVDPHNHWCRNLRHLLELDAIYPGKINRHNKLEERYFNARVLVEHKKALEKSLLAAKSAAAKSLIPLAHAKVTPSPRHDHAMVEPQTIDSIESDFARAKLTQHITPMESIGRPEDYDLWLCSNREK